jgi:hypothetical protein
MHYKTIVLELLESPPALYEQLRASGSLLSTMNKLASLLRDLHLQTLEELQQAQPSESQAALSSEAMELAVHQLQQSLLPAEPNSETFSLDQAMLYLKHHLRSE